MCAKCEEEDPPDSTSNTISWVMCDQCCSWFHDMCVAVVSSDVQGNWFCNNCVGKSFCQLCFFDEPVINGEVVEVIDWIQCDGCTNWFHSICVGVEDSNTLPTWFCSICNH